MNQIREDNTTESSNNIITVQSTQLGKSNSIQEAQASNDVPADKNTTSKSSAKNLTNYRNPMGKISKQSGSASFVTHSDSDIDKFLVEEQITNLDEPWNKLNKPERLKRFNIYADEYVKTNNLDKSVHDKLIIFLKDCLDRKKLSKVKEIEYDKTKGVVRSIPGLVFTKHDNHFTLKNMDKKKAVTTTATLSTK